MISICHGGWWLVVGGWCGGWFEYAFQLIPTTNHQAPTTALNKKAADMISRLCSNVESFRGADSYAPAEKLFLVRFNIRAATGIRGVLSPRASGQIGGV